MADKLIIGLEDAHLTFGGKPLFEGLHLYINEGDKICLVGKNGAGKTTLMRLITGELEIDAGKRFLYPGTTVGYLEQKVDFDPNHSVKEFVVSGLPEESKEEKHYLADMIIAPLELMAETKMSILSGGQLRRAALARALVREPDLLLLDEPTNHLDLGAIEWLEKYLASYKGALICVSHDRAFLKAVSKKVFWIDRGQIRVSPGGYAEFDEWAEMVIQQEARELQNLQKKLDAEIDWTQGGVTGRRKRNVRRLNELARLREKIRADKAAYQKATNKIELDPLAVTIGSKRMVEFKHVKKSFTRDGAEIQILNDFNLTILRGDRIGILGKNGSGKSTFLKLLVGELEQDGGIIRRAKNIDISYFDQNRSDLNPQNTILKTLCPEGGEYLFLGHGKDRKPRHVCGYLKNFLFDPKILKDYVGTLSGGQQNRLMLAKMLASPGNLLILDEPTNDLDMDTLDMLQEILSDYPGTLIIVSHDRDFLDRTVTEILAFEGDAKVENFIGGYSDYLADKKPSIKKETKEKPSQKKNPTKKLSYKFKFEHEQLSKQIADLELELKELGAVLSNADLYMKDPAAFDTATKRYGKAKQELEKAETKWLEIDEMRDNATA